MCAWKRSRPARPSSTSRRCGTGRSSPRRPGNRIPPSTAKSSRSFPGRRVPLDPEVAALLEHQGTLPPRSSLDVAATREMMRQAAALAGEAARLNKVEDFLPPARLGARQYWPALDDRLPIILYLHGGRFFSGDLDSHDTLCRLLALATACRVVAVDYRLAPEHVFPAAVDDACGAVEWACQQRVPVGIMGDSA